MMNLITATLEANIDGALHLPLPPALRHGKVKVTATVEPAEPHPAEVSVSPLKGFGCLKGKIWMADNFDAPLDDFREYME